MNEATTTTAASGTVEMPSSTRINDQPAIELQNFLLVTVGSSVLAQELSTILHQGGVTTLTHLIAVARMPLAEQVKFLKNDLDLNPLQMRLLQGVLDERPHD